MWPLRSICRNVSTSQTVSSWLTNLNQIIDLFHIIKRFIRVYIFAGSSGKRLAREWRSALKERKSNDGRLWIDPEKRRNVVKRIAPTHHHWLRPFCIILGNELKNTFTEFPVYTDKNIRTFIDNESEVEALSLLPRNGDETVDAVIGNRSLSDLEICLSPTAVDDVFGRGRDRLHLIVLVPFNGGIRTSVDVHNKCRGFTGLHISRAVVVWRGNQQKRFIFFIC